MEHILGRQVGGRRENSSVSAGEGHAPCSEPITYIIINSSQDPKPEFLTSISINTEHRAHAHPTFTKSKPHSLSSFEQILTADLSLVRPFHDESTKMKTSFAVILATIFSTASAVTISLPSGVSIPSGVTLPSGVTVVSAGSSSTAQSNANNNNRNNRNNRRQNVGGGALSALSGLSIGLQATQAVNAINDAINSANTNSNNRHRRQNVGGGALSALSGLSIGLVQSQTAANNAEQTDGSA